MHAPASLLSVEIGGITFCSSASFTSKFLFSPDEASEFITRQIYQGLNRRSGMLEGCKDEINHVG